MTETPVDHPSSTETPVDHPSSTETPVDHPSSPEGANWHPGVNGILQFFDYLHLPPHLQDVSMPFNLLAWDLARTCPHNPELTAGLRKLLEAKDCAVRAVLAK